MNFTHTKPTVPGAYWWRLNGSGTPYIYELKMTPEGLMISSDVGDCPIDPNYGEWSSRLVPVDEVEKAYREGWHNRIYCDVETIEELTWLDSNARRVVDGRDGM
jgi:hypothetical protein